MIWLLLLALDLKVVERHYNSAQTLAVDFEQNYVASGQRRSESGTLTLRKPGRMRWDYSHPAGKVFVSDGKTLWYYSPLAQRAEHSKVKESADLRAPLAFLLGKLDFHRDFTEIREEGGEIVALPKSDRAPYREVRFTADADGVIHRVKVTGQDASQMEFVFRNERRNVPVKDALFRFIPPAGAEVVDVNAEQ